MNNLFKLKSSWSSSKDDLVNDFYKPVLKDCLEFQFISNFSTVFNDLVHELAVFTNIGGKIKLIINLDLFLTENEISELDTFDSDKSLVEFFTNFLKKMKSYDLESIKILGQILSKEIDGISRIEIKFAIPRNIFEKSYSNMGVFHYENGEKISISSTNENSNVVNSKIENFSVYTSWSDETNSKMAVIQKKFSDLWNNNNRNVGVYDLPELVKNHILEISMDSIKKNNLGGETSENDSEPEKNLDDEKSDYISKNNEKSEDSSILRTEFQFFEHQKEAISNWISNDMCGLLEMATGTGKTITSFGCISQLQKNHERLVTVIACPYKHLVEQWKKEFEKYNSNVNLNEKISFEKIITCDGDYPKWKTQFNNMIFDFNEIPLGGKTPQVNKIVIFVTHDTLASIDFSSRLGKLTNTKKFLIIDEVHEITESRSSKVLLSDYQFRLGLSATPNRHMDFEGTQILKTYFHSSKCNIVNTSDDLICKNCSKKFIAYSLDLKKAIHDLHVLCEYDYHPYYVELTYEEMSIYIDLTMQIAQLEQKRKKGIKLSKKESYPYLARANLIANAENKDRKLEEILDIEFKNHLQRTLIYCTSTRRSESNIDDLNQLERVKKILFDHKIKSDSVTHHDVTKLRLEIISALEGGILDCITAVGCLDQGVDIPSVENAIIMASTGNPKQYIQRRGRILRQSKLTGKEKAFIYDILVAPPLPDLDVEIRNIERKIFAKELLRHKEFAKISNNENEATSKMKVIAKKYNLDFDRLDHDYIKDELS